MHPNRPPLDLFPPSLAVTLTDRTLLPSMLLTLPSSLFTHLSTPYTFPTSTTPSISPHRPSTEPTSTEPHSRQLEKVDEGVGTHRLWRRGRGCGGDHLDPKLLYLVEKETDKGGLEGVRRVEVAPGEKAGWMGGKWSGGWWGC